MLQSIIFMYLCCVLEEKISIFKRKYIELRENLILENILN